MADARLPWQVAIKAGWDCAGYEGEYALPSTNITIRNLTAWRGGGGIAIGSEMCAASDFRVCLLLIASPSRFVPHPRLHLRGSSHVCARAACHRRPLLVSPPAAACRSGGVSHVRVSNVLLQHGSYGIYLKTGSSRGGCL